MADGAGLRDPLLLSGIRGGYGKLQVVNGVDLAVPAGSVVALLGPNGAGKTTLLKIAAGLLPPMSGQVLLNGEDVTRKPPHHRARVGLCHIPEGRSIFRSLSVRTNLELSIPPWVSDQSFDRAVKIFPILGKRLAQIAGSLSGGEQQALAMARAFLASPTVVMADEVSLGLAPLVVSEIFDSLMRLKESGVALLMVEQYVTRALEMADSVYLMNRGRISFHGLPAEVDQDSVMQAYLGLETH